MDEGGKGGGRKWMREGREEEGKGRGAGVEREREREEEEGGNRGGRGEKRDAREMRQENWLIDRPKVSGQTRDRRLHRHTE